MILLDSHWQYTATEERNELMHGCLGTLGNRVKYELRNIGSPKVCLEILVSLPFLEGYTIVATRVFLAAGRSAVTINVTTVPSCFAKWNFLF